MGAEEDISLALRPLVEAAGLEIWDVERAGTSVRVMVEGDGGVDLDAIAELSGAISAALDQRDDLVPSGRYTLEVSSPGLERRLRYPRHFARYVGQTVAVKTLPGADVPRRLRGTLMAARERDITVRAELPSGLQEVQLPLSVIDRATTVFDWGQPAARPAKGRPAAKPSSRSGASGKRELAPSREAR
jgi:ribosome maturation factor RimP